MKTAYGIVLVFVMLATTGCSEGRESKPYSEFTCLEFQNDSEKELFQQSGVIPKGTLISNKEKQVCNNGQFNVVMSENTFTDED
jgi:PBP1b-binding outer membrane lipoprotein LpoB